MMLESGQGFAARYTLLRKLGAGRSSEIWLARDGDAAGERVLKIARGLVGPEREQFLVGLRLQQQVEHPNVLRVAALDSGEPAFAVLDYAPGGDASRMRGRGWHELRTLLTQVAEACSALHERGHVHRDLKTSNVLLDASGRALLTDFEIAAPIGDRAARSGGSPFATSPQQLDGAPPAIADDVYSFGALAYELLTGYPPFYPDPLPERIRAEPPAPLPARLGIPKEVEQLLQQCLAKQPEDRPANLRVVAEALRSAAPAGSEQPGREPEPGRVALRAPQSQSPAIEPKWQRRTGAAPDPAQLRSQGFRRGLVAGALAFLLLAAGLVFLVLPDWVERRSPAPASTPVPTSTPKPAPTVPSGQDLARLAELKQQFEEARPPVVARLTSLDARRAGAWAGDPFARGRQALTDADAAYARRDFAAALERLATADETLAGVERLAATTLRDALAAGRAAIDAGVAPEARKQFELALAVDPANAEAKRGLERAGTLDEVRRLLASAAASERDGNVAAAESGYRKVLELDPDTAAAREGLSRIQAAASSAAFSAAISQGLAATSRRDFAAAREAFERAGRIRPGAPEAREGLAAVERAVGDRVIGDHLAAAQRAEGEERWADAVTGYRKALDADRNLLAAQQGLERSEPRAMLAAELEAYVGKPERLFSSEVRGAARAALARASAIPSPGPVLAQQMATVTGLLTAAETPVRVEIASDSQTEVTIYRVGKLGVFDRKDMELLPGRYTVVGTRSGFRDVRRELTVLPGREATALVIRCEEQI
jgi:tetratricopeptide (TPR) repeat protein